MLFHIFNDKNCIIHSVGKQLEHVRTRWNWFQTCLKPARTCSNQFQTSLKRVQTSLEPVRTCYNVSRTCSNLWELVSNKFEICSNTLKRVKTFESCSNKSWHFQKCVLLVIILCLVKRHNYQVFCLLKYRSLETNWKKIAPYVIPFFS